MFSLDTKDDASSEDVLEVLENIDDDLDRLNVGMVKVSLQILLIIANGNGR